MTGQALSLAAEAGKTPIGRILVVDDSRLQRSILAKSLRRAGHDVIEADSADAALAICAATPPDIVFSDWVMPGMSGLDFCRAFRAMPRERYGYFILLTSKSDAHDITQGFEAGADDFLIKPATPDDLRARISAATRILTMERQLSEKNRMISDTLAQLQAAYERIDQDLLQAKTIQESLVPEVEGRFGPSRVSLLLKPCGHIGGDLVGMFSPGKNRVAFYNIDVSGHGITSAMMTARLGSYLSSSHLDQNVAVEKRLERFFALRQPAEVASILNARLAADTGIAEYFTMIYCIADLRSGDIRLVQAGHPHPLLMRADGRREFLGHGGVPVGLLPDARFDQIDFRMQTGDRLLLYSDGISECVMQDGSMLDQSGLLSLIDEIDSDSGREFLDDLFWRLSSRMRRDSGMEDDVSATLFEYLGDEA
ncbi:MAG: fused response regulator/phosphatase [Proteobacteria bacterium]|nr:fused response regulator/phosphatase [Pseudomonadota bacterium]